MVSLGGEPPAPLTCSRFAAFMQDGLTDGEVHVGHPDGTVKTASFALFRAYIYGPPKHGASAASALVEHP